MILTSLASSISTLSLTRMGSGGSLSSDAIRQNGLLAAQMQAVADESDAKARAAQKIAYAKEQLEFLQRGGFPPEVIARLAAQLAGQLQSAAAQFAQAVAAGAANAAAVNQAPAASATEATTGANTVNQRADAADDASETNLFQKEYQSVAEDGESVTAGSDEDDLLSEFEALIRQARQLERKKQAESEA